MSVEDKVHGAYGENSYILCCKCSAFFSITYYKRMQMRIILLSVYTLRVFCVDIYSGVLS